MSKILQIKILLLGSKPPIWRRVLMDDGITFHQFHEIIQMAMGWENAHLYSFDLGTVRIELPDDYGIDTQLDARKTKVSDYLNLEGAILNYEYDFGDYWLHQILLEKIESPQKGQTLPICIMGKGNCPPEDCGGIWGYYELLDILGDENHPEHEDRLEWLGEDFDPTHFQKESINARLARWKRS